jgi:hypothetical protein
MKAILRHGLVIITAAVFFSVSAYAQSANMESVAEKAFKVCPASLNSDIPGIVESTIYNIVLIKKYYPNANYSPIVEKLNEIAEENPNLSIRFKAHLASIYLGFSEGINIQPEFNTYDHEYLFREITDQLESKLLVSSK